MADGIGETGYIVLTGIAEREGVQFVSYCRELGTSSCGDTVEEALENLGDAIEVHLNGLTETGEVLDFLRAKNIRINLQPIPDEVDIRVPPEKLITTYQRQVPAAQPA